MLAYHQSTLVLNRSLILWLVSGEYLPPEIVVKTTNILLSIYLIPGPVARAVNALVLTILPCRDQRDQGDKDGKWTGHKTPTLVCLSPRPMP